MGCEKWVNGYLHLLGYRICLVHINSLKLKKLCNIVECGESDNGEDVPKTIANTALQTNTNTNANKSVLPTMFLLKGLQMLKYLSRATATTLYTLPAEGEF